jgi:S1-C subfamily serine protease
VPPGASTPQPAASGLAARVEPGLVDVYTLIGLPGGGAAAGTGIVLTPSGEVLTNNHVVEGSSSVKVTDVGNGQTYDAIVVGTDKSADVAVLQLEGASGLATVTTGDSAKVSVGDAVTAIGNAGGSGGTPTVTTGTVTALGQSIVASDAVDNSQEHLTGLLETDAVLEPGDSGGPLVDNSAKVIAIDTAASADYQFQSGPSASYAVPVDGAISIAKQIESGVASSSVHIGPSAQLGVVVGDASRRGAGAQVVTVLSGSPADQAGISPGDLITSLDGQSVDGPTALAGLVYEHRPGDVVRISWTDVAGRPHTATERLEVGPAG